MAKAPPKTETPTSTEPESGNPPAEGSQPTPGADAPRVNETEARIEQQQRRALEERVGEQGSRLAAAEGRANALEGELKKEKGLREAAETQVVQLTAELSRATTAAKNAGAQLSDLPKNAFQLNESVTLGSYSRRVQARQGDVIIVARSDDEVAALQQEVGLAYTVHKVTSAEAQELKGSGFLHGS